MHNLIIRPLEDFFKKIDRDHLRCADLAQLEDKIENQRARKEKNPAQAHSVYVEEKYLEVLAELKARYSPSARIALPELRSAVTQILAAKNFVYEKKEWPRRHPNVFWRTADHDAPLPADVQSYDVAFYNSGATGVRQSHHPYHTTDKKLVSVFYFRCEERPAEQEILIGNLQLDDNAPLFWENPAIAKLMLNPKNSELMMVQQAVKHALERGFTRIKFHAGTAAFWAQFHEKSITRVLITKENYAHYDKIYKNKLARYHKIKCGDYFCYPEGRRYTAYEKTPAGWKFSCLAPGIYNNFFESYIWDTYENNPKTAVYGHKLYDAVNARDVAATHAALTGLVRLVDTQAVPPDEHAAQIKFIDQEFKKRLKRIRTPDRSMTAIIAQEFLRNFGYVELLLKNAPHMKKYTNARTGKVFYINRKMDDSLFHELPRSSLTRPKIGEYYEYFEPWPGKRLPELDYANDPRYKILNWYDNKLPKLLKKSGLSISRVQIKTTGRKPRITGDAWQIDGGLEEFNHKAFTVFATHADYKKDLVTMPALRQAAQKFGLSADQVQLVNGWISENGEKHTALYNKKTDEIKLSTASLSLLAHEGLHRLLARGLVPKREFKAMCDAGKRLAAQSPLLRDYFQQKTAEDKLLYPPGKNRDEEYACVFAEVYFENRSRARKLLVDEKLTCWERVVDYLEELITIIQIRLGHEPALAQRFLRRLAQAAPAGPSLRLNAFANPARQYN